MTGSVVVATAQFVVQGGGGSLPGPFVSPAIDETERRHTRANAGSRRFIGDAPNSN